MGYYVRGYGSIKIEQNKIEPAYEAMCALNDHDELKRGGSYGGPNDANNARPDGMNYHPGRWFSWMDANYPETCADFWAILTQLGFDYVVRGTDEVIELTLDYDNKMGQEDEFLTALAPFVLEGSLEWSGEDGERWLQEFGEGEMKVKSGRVVFE